jgi:hypothetical protein
MGMVVDGRCSEAAGTRRGGDASSTGSHAHLPQDSRVALQPQQLPLLLEHLPAHLQDHLKTLLALLRVLLEPVHRELLDAVPYLLPSAAERRDLSALLHERLVLR